MESQNSQNSQKTKQKKMNYKLIGVAIIIIIALVGGALGVALVTRSPNTVTTATATQTVTSSGVTTATITATTTSTATSSSTSKTLPSVILNGAGSTFQQPVLSVMIPAYEATRTDIALTVNYQGVGSGAGISDLEAGTVDFAASDVPGAVTLPTGAPASTQVLWIPDTIGCVTVSYNLKLTNGTVMSIHDQPLYLNGSVIAGIFDGQITSWNDPHIAALNPNIASLLPAKSIVAVHRSDSSGTTYIFSGYLCKESSYFNATDGPGPSKTTVFTAPNLVGANGNAGVAAVVQGDTYSIGYVELAYALQNTMPVSAIQNVQGNWILPSLNSTQIAVQAAALSGLPANNQSWTKVSLLNANAAGAYPIVAFTYLVVYKELDVIPGMTQSMATALAQFLYWVVQTSGGQSYSNGISFAQLPSNVVTIDDAGILSLTFNGQSLNV
ncbi:MAG TPA: phosphate ABC transporter substrate-binding protein PstS [archaeon]|nr:phosphate ABC transporter substrate-binding protein PstS [archaeon]